MLQEANSIGKYAGFEYNHMTVFGHRICDCALLVDSSLTPDVRETRCSSYWFAVVIGNCVFISLHLLFDNHHHVQFGQSSKSPSGEDGDGDNIKDDDTHNIFHGQRDRQNIDDSILRAEFTLDELSEYIGEVRCRLHVTSICIGCDANTQLSSSVDGTTGPGVYAHPTHVSRSLSVQAFLEAHGLRASNTWQQDLAQCWTWGRGRKKQRSRRQIDYLFVSSTFTGTSQPLDPADMMSQTPNKSDHRLVKGDFEVELNVDRAPIDYGLKGWQPSHEEAKGDFLSTVMENRDSSTTLDQLERNLSDTAKAVEATTGPHRQWQNRQVINQPWKEARAAVARAAPENKRELVLRMRKTRRVRNKKMNELKLAKIKMFGMVRRQPTFLSIDGNKSTNRTEWTNGVFGFGSSRFGCRSNEFSIQSERLASLDHGLVEHIDLWDLMQSRAAMKTDTAAGMGDIVPEVLKVLPFLSMFLILKLFNERQENALSPEAPFWKHIKFWGLLKNKGSNEPNDFRWIALVSVLSKWYARGLRALLRRQRVPGRTHLYGFMRHRRTTDITGLIRQLLLNGHAWYPGTKVYVLSADIRTAFDAINHDVATRALLHSGIQPKLVSNFLRELSLMTASMMISGCKETGSFNFEQGGKQGGVETPDIFNCCLEMIMSPLIESWVEKGWGVRRWAATAEGDAEITAITLEGETEIVICKPVHEMVVLGEKSTGPVRQVGAQSTA